MPRLVPSRLLRWTAALLGAALATGWAPDTKNQLDACPVDRDYSETAVHGSILYCEDVDGETCYGDGCDCWDTPPRLGDLRVLVEVSERGELGEAVVCSDEERRAELEASGERNPGFPFLFAYVSEALQPDEEVVLWSTDFHARALPEDDDSCWGRRSLTLDGAGVASAQLTEQNMGRCQ